MRGPSDKRLREMPPSVRFDTLRHVIFQYIDWLRVTAAYRAEHEEPFDDTYDDVAFDLDGLVADLRDYADAIEKDRKKRTRRLAQERTLKALAEVSEKRGSTAAEVANARTLLARKQAKHNRRH